MIRGATMIAAMTKPAPAAPTDSNLSKARSMTANRTRSRKNRRAAALHQEPVPPARAPAPKPKRGRPPGRTFLRDRPLAREAVLFHLFRVWLRWKPRQAATFAAAVGNKSVVIELTEVTTKGLAGWAGFSFTYTAGDRKIVQGRESNSLNHRRDRILQYGPAMIAGATGGDLAWLQLSMQALERFFTALFKLDIEGLRAAEELLRSPAIGWRIGSKAELFLKDQRYQRAKIELIDT
jgi:hypothetical protein